MNPATPEYFQGVRRLCDERGLLFIVDEVQTGLGRTGAWFGYQHFGVRPDVVTLAKALGNGVPIGACWARRDVAAAFEPGDHGTHLRRHPDRHGRGQGAVLAELARIDAPAARHRARARRFVDGADGHGRREGGARPRPAAGGRAGRPRRQGRWTPSCWPGAWWPTR